MKTYLKISLCLCLSIRLLANNTGTISGTVFDTKTDESLYGANVMIRGTLLGASTGSAGDFIINSLPPGKYTVEVSMIGYKKHTEIVTLNANQRQQLTIKLEPTVLVQPNVLVTASKRKQHIEDAPTSVDIVDMRDIRARNITNLDEMLQNVSGFRVIDGQIDLRGSTGFNWAAGSRVLLLIDGHPMINGDSGGINWDFIPVEEIKRVEIVKGAGSALYGSNAMAGMVNIITHDPQEKPVTRVRLTYGAYDQPAYDSWRWSDRFLTYDDFDLMNALSFSGVDISHSRQIKNVGILASWGRKYSTGYHQNGDYSRNSIFLKTKIRLSTQKTLTLATNWALNDHGEFLQWKSPEAPMQVLEEELGYRIKYNKGSINGTYQQAVNKHLAFSVKSNWYRTDWENNFDHSDYATTDRFGAEGQADILIGKNSITTGIELATNIADSRIYGDQDTRDAAVYAENAFKFSDKLTSTLGVRYDYHQVVDVSSDQQLSPRFGTVFKPMQGTSFRFSAGYGFRAPSIAEVFANTTASGIQVVPNLELKDAERGINLEFGINQTLSLVDYGSTSVKNPLRYLCYMLSPVMTLDASVFQSQLRNMIDVDYNPKVEAYQFMNMGRARIRGTEIKVKAILWNGLMDMQAGVTLLDPINLDTKKTLNYRAKTHIVTGFGIHYHQLSLGMDYRYASRTEEIINILGSQYEERVPTHVVDARISYSRWNYTLAFEVKNARNYHYTLRQRFLEPLRHYVVTLRGNF